MRKLLLLGLIGCWSPSSKPATQPKPVENTAKASTGGETYGGAMYGGAAYGGLGYADGGTNAGGGNVTATGKGPLGVTPTSSLDPAIINRYVKQNLPKIQFCYEKELLNDPSLQGTVVVNFLIETTGNVTSASGSGVSPAVANCVARVILAIAFPKPKNGAVQVAYPFIFKPATP